MFDKFAHGSSRRKRRRRRRRLLSVHQIIGAAEQGFLVRDETALYQLPCPQTMAGGLPQPNLGYWTLQALSIPSHSSGRGGDDPFLNNGY
jgi:hypothetical protein